VVGHDGSVVGFDPYRKKSRRPGDYVLMAAALLAIAAALVWVAR